MKLKDFRKDKGLTQVEMSEKIGTSFSYYQKVENGNKNTSFNFISKIKKVFPEIDANIFFKN